MAARDGGAAAIAPSISTAKAQVGLRRIQAPATTNRGAATSRAAAA
jgi:hypothetical protein